MSVTSKVKIKFNKPELLQVATQAGCSETQANKLWDLLSQNAPSTGYFDGLNKLYFFGGLIIFSAMSLFFFMSSVIQGEGTLLALSLTYALIFNAVGIYLWKIKQKTRLGGISCLFSLLLIPIAAYALQSTLNWWPFEESFSRHYGITTFIGERGLFLITTTTILASLTTLYFVRFPLLTAILYPFMWVMCELASLPLIKILNDPVGIYYIGRAVHIVSACGIIAIGYLLDKKNKKDFAFWAYLNGVILFWGNITFPFYWGELPNLIYLLTNVGLFYLWVKLKQRIFVICGTLGIIDYLSLLYLRHDFSLAFPVTLSILGLIVIGIGIFLKKRREKTNRD